MKYKCRRFAGITRCGKPATELWYNENAAFILMVCRKHKFNPKEDKSLWRKITPKEATVIEIMNS
jgi:hypothetical protein